MQFIYEARAKVLLNRGDTATNAHVLSVRCIFRPLQGGIDAVRHEVKCCAALHLDRVRG